MGGEEGEGKGWRKKGKDGEKRDREEKKGIGMRKR
jgi:hypothetical protein